MGEAYVAEHLRFIISINKDRTFTQTIQPSEPVLAHAAIQLLSHRPRLLDSLNASHAACLRATIDIGDIGELVAAMTIIFSVVLAQVTTGDRLPRLMKVEAFFGLLFGVSFGQQVANQIKGEDGLQDIWTNGYMVCNHFVHIYNQPDKSTIRAAFSCGAGIILPPRYPSADLLIPIKPIGGFVDKKSITCLLVQVKNRADDTMTSGLSIEAASPVMSAAKELGLTLKYFDLIMCLRGQKDEQSRKISLISNRPAGTKRQKMSEAVVITTVGFGSQLFPNIAPKEGSIGREIYATLSHLLYWNWYMKTKRGAKGEKKAYIRALLEMHE